MRKLLLASLFITLLLQAASQGTSAGFTLQRPKLVVGIMIDQMRWDYLYRYYNSYGENGFKRLLGNGFSCENTMIPYAQTVTAAGHSSVYTGSVPAFNGIIGNEWYDRDKGRAIYCTEDNTVKILGGNSLSAPMSPKNLWVSTVCDELRLATNFKSKVIGVAIKDRGCILPSGRSANAAYWYDDKTGNWVTSTYYMSQLPVWVEKFNDRKLADSFFHLNWNTLVDIKKYTQSTDDNEPYEGKYNNESSITFPHQLDNQVGKDYNLLRATPYGNTLTLLFAKKALESEKLGKGGSTDFLDISLSSTDVVGHQTGTTSVETEDMYRRLDKDLGDFLTYLDATVGKGNYLLFLTADHGASQAPGFLKEHGLAGKALVDHGAELNAAVKNKFGVSNAVIGSYVLQFYLNNKVLDSAGINKNDVKQFIIDYLNKKEEVYLAFDTKDINKINLPADIKEKIYKGFNPKTGGDIQLVLKPGYFYGKETGTQHGVWYPYDAHIPLVFYGWKIKPGQLNREVYMTDIAPTVAALLHIQMPSGCIGKPIYEVTQR
jgi:predicted AlkP superfamily pyrophosphatase or phosphodiesterase